MENKGNVRRVGTITMGLYLIVIGIVVLCANFLQNIDLIFILKLTPIVFILLGIEVVVYNFVLKSEKIKYDVFSIFICFILIFATICTAIIPWGLTYFGPDREEKVNSYEKMVYDECFNSLKGNDKILSLNVGTCSDFFDNIDYTENIRTYLTIKLSEDILDEKTFANECYEILSKLNSLNISFTRIDFYSINSDKKISLTLDNKFSQNLGKEKLCELIDVELIEEI